MDELSEEHKHIDYFLTLIRKETKAKELSFYIRQFRAILNNHLQKEEDALFPLAESILDGEGMNRAKKWKGGRVRRGSCLMNTRVLCRSREV